MLPQGDSGSGLHHAGFTERATVSPEKRQGNAWPMGVKGSERMVVSMSWKMHACSSCSIHPVTAKPDFLGEPGGGPGCQEGARGTVYRCRGVCLGEAGGSALNAGGAGAIPMYLPHPSRGPGANDVGSLEGVNAVCLLPCEDPASFTFTFKEKDTFLPRWGPWHLPTFSGTHASLRSSFACFGWTVYFHPVSPLEAASLTLHLPPTLGQPESLHPSLQVMTTMAIIVIALIFLST